MNISITQTLPPVIKPYPQEEEKQQGLTQEEGSTSLEWVRFSPLIGSFCAHNFTQSLLLNKTVTYFANPVTNYFMNPLIASLAGSAAFFIAKAGLSSKEQKNAPTDHEGVSKAILWSSAFTTLSAYTIKELVLKGAADPVSKLFCLAIPSPLAELGFVVASTCLCAAIYDLASDMFKEEPQKEPKKAFENIQ